MPRAGDSYIVELKDAHIKWGEYHPSRHSHTRNAIYGEGYIQIPADKADRFDIFNSNNPFGIGTDYNCVSYDGYYSGIVRAQGNQGDGIHAKQFAEANNLKGIGDWYNYIGAIAGDYVKVKFTSPNDIIIEHCTTKNFHI
jgi:hypothetical protein